MTTDQDSVKRSILSRLSRQDLKATPLTGLSWTSTDSEGSMNHVFEHVRRDALGAIDWYREARRPKRRMATTLRMSVVLFAGAAAVLPLISTLNITGNAGQPGLGWAWLALFQNPLWVSVVLAAGAGAIALDRALGFSSGWIRYIKTEMQLRDALEAFELDWELERAKWRGSEPSVDQVTVMLGQAKAFAMRINGIVDEETKAWIEEFQSAVKQLDQAMKAREQEIKARAEVEQKGALNLVVTNGDQFEEWKLSIDGGAERIYRGKTAALGDIPPGIRVLKVSGKAQGAEKKAEHATTVPAGSTGSAELTLS